MILKHFFIYFLFFNIGPFAADQDLPIVLEQEDSSRTEVMVEYQDEELGRSEHEVIPLSVSSSLPTSEELGTREDQAVPILKEGKFIPGEVSALDNSPSEAYIKGSVDLGEVESDSPIRRAQVTARYLGVLGQVGIDLKVFNQVSMGLYFGKYQGKVAGSDKSGVIPDLDHLNLQTTIFLNSKKQAFQTGGQLRFGLHANKQSNSDLVESIVVDGQEVIRPGQTRIGSLIGVGYGWYGKRFGFNIGAEYLSLGALKSLIPLVLSLGVTF